MSADRTNCFGMANSRTFSTVKLTNMSVRQTLVVNRRRITSLRISPLEIMVHIASQLTISRLAAAAVDTRRHPGITRKTFGTGKSLNIAKLRCYHYRQNKSYPRQSHQPFYFFSFSNTTSTARFIARKVSE